MSPPLLAQSVHGSLSEVTVGAIARPSAARPSAPISCSLRSTWIGAVSGRAQKSAQSPWMTFMGICSRSSIVIVRESVPLDCTSICAVTPPVASLPPLPPPVASAAVAPPPRQPVLPAAAVAATLGKIDAAVQEVNRAQQIKADRGAKSAKKAEDHNRARSASAMKEMRPPVPQAHRVGAQNVPRPTKQLRPHGEKKKHVLSPPPRAFLSTASPVRSPPPPLSPANEPWRLPPKSAAKRPEAAREFRRDLAVAASKASRGAAADARRGL